MLAVCVVHEHHRELQSTCLVELDKSEDTGCCLLATSDHVRNEVYILCMHEVHEVTAIVDDDIRSHLKNSSDVFLVLLWSSIIPSENIESRLNEGSGNIILGRKRVASCNIHLRTTCRENFAKICGLGLEMH